MVGRPRERPRRTRRRFFSPFLGVRRPSRASGPRQTRRPNGVKKHLYTYLRTNVTQSSDRENQTGEVTEQQNNCFTPVSILTQTCHLHHSQQPYVQVLTGTKPVISHHQGRLNSNRVRANWGNSLVLEPCSE